ncbi:MAG: hypothetical protein JNM13_15010 [Hyphomicrobiaceae bacterium]|nr:hypothetical protein [Hyphomicrobiaceae bacterium]
MASWFDLGARGLTALGLFLGLAGPVVAVELDAAAIRDRLVDQSILWWADGGFLHGGLELAADGSAAITMENPSGADIGRWRLDGAALCTRWNAARSGDEKCYRIRQVAPHRFVTTGGNVFELIAPGM